MLYLLNLTSPYGGVNVYHYDNEDEALESFNGAVGPFSHWPKVELKTTDGTTVKAFVKGQHR